MVDVKRLRLPLSEADVRELRVGDLVVIDGDIVITAGLPTHRRMLEYLREGRQLPFELDNGALFHLGGYSRSTESSLELLYINPTTSTRFNDFMPEIIRSCRLRMTGGKGGLDARSVEAMKDVGCVYLSFIGGGCTLLSRAIREVTGVAWEDLLIHYRMTKVRVEGLGPATVGIDAHGKSVYESGSTVARAKLPEIMQMLNQTRLGAS